MMAHEVESIYMWVMVEKDGTEGPLAIAIPGFVAGPMMSTKLPVAEKFRPQAVQHMKASGHTVKLCRYDFAVVLVEINP